jgi:hypothetical protein
MSKKRAFVRYSKQGKITPGSLILTNGSYPNGSAVWNEVPVDLCCNNLQNSGYTCCIAIQGIADGESGQYGFTLQVRNGGTNLRGSIQWTPTESESFSLSANGEDYDFEYNFEDLIPHTVYLCIDNPSQIQDFEIGFGPGTSIAISNLQKLEGIEEWDGDNMGFTSLDFTGITTITELYNESTGLQHINITGCVNLNNVELEDNDLTEASVDHILITLDDNGLSNGYVNLNGGTNATPSALGLAAEASLVIKGWTVNVNS